MTVTKSLEAYGTEEFKDVLMEELNDNPMDLPLEAGCEHGGFPDLEDEVNVYQVTGVHHDEYEIHATISISFREAVNTSCADVQVPFAHDITCNMSIEKSTGYCEFDVVEQEHEPEF